MNIALTIPQNQVEDFLKVAVFALLVEEFELRRSPLGLPRSLNVAADLAELSESLMRRIEQQRSRGVMGHQIGSMASNLSTITRAQCASGLCAC